MLVIGSSGSKGGLGGKRVAGGSRASGGSARHLSASMLIVWACSHSASVISARSSDATAGTARVGAFFSFSRRDSFRGGRARSLSSSTALR